MIENLLTLIKKRNFRTNPKMRKNQNHLEINLIRWPIKLKEKIEFNLVKNPLEENKKDIPTAIVTCKFNGTKHFLINE